jgi:hypothetical protein
LSALRVAARSRRSSSPAAAAGWAASTSIEQSKP